MNILEQEDQLKGMPDSMLLMEMEQPSGMYPPFLVASEQQRRNTMRENYAASEEQPTTTVVEREYQKGLASAMPPSSPAPVAPNSLPPPIPVGGLSQGSMGAGDLVMANTGGQFPDLSGDGKITKKDILMGRGVVTMDTGGLFSRAYDYLVPDNPFALAQYLAGKGVDVAKYSADQLKRMYRQYKQEEELGESAQQGLYEEISARNTAQRLPTEDLMERYESAGEMGAPFGGVGAEEPSGRFGTMIENIQTNLQDAERFPTANMSEYERSRLDPVARTALDAREGVIAGVDTLGEVGKTGLESLLDFGTVLTTGDPDDPAGQREEALGEVVESGGNFLTRYLPDLSLEGGTALVDRVGDYLSDPETMESFESGFQNLLDTYGEPVADFIDDPFGLRGYLEDAPAAVREESNVSENPSVKTDAARAGFPTSSQETIMQNILAGGPQQPGFVGGNMVADSLVRDAVREGIDEGLGIGEESMINLEDAYGRFDTAQAEQTANLRDLIGRTRQEAKDRAFYMGLAALGAGIAKGDMAGGMDKAVEIASDITARGEASIAPLEAAAATQPAQAAKDRIDALAAIARADATFQNVRAQLVREGGLDRRSYNQLRGYALRAAQQAVENLEYAEGLDTPEAVAKAINQIADQMMGEYAPLMENQLSEDFVINPLTGNLQFRNTMPSQ